MLQKYLGTFQSILKILRGEGHKRSVEASRSIIISFIIKGIAVVVNMMYVPICIDYLDKERYGIWLTLSSIIGWISFFDLGLGNGLRNRLTAALARNDLQKAREYVSTSYFLFSSIFLSAIVIFMIVNPFLDWVAIFNTKTTIVSESELHICALVVFIFFSLRFIFLNISIIAYSRQRPFLSHLFATSGSVLSLILIYILKYLSPGKGDLTYLVFIASSSQVFVLLFASLILFNKNEKFSTLKPKFKFINVRLSKDLLSLGLNFFVIQIVGLILFASANVIVTQIYGPKEVVVLNVAYKYYLIAPMLFGIIMSPIWSAVTDAVHRDDFAWLKKTMKGLHFISAIFVVGVIFMTLISGYFYKLWVGNRVSVPPVYSLVMGIWATINVAFAPYSQYINGFGKLKFSVRYSLVGIVLFIGLAILLTKTSLRASGVMAATCIVNGASLMFVIYQVNLLLNKKAHGIWNK